MTIGHREATRVAHIPRAKLSFVRAPEVLEVGSMRAFARATPHNRHTIGLKGLGRKV